MFTGNNISKTANEKEFSHIKFSLRTRFVEELTIRNNRVSSLSTEYHILGVFLTSFKRCGETVTKFTKQLSMLVKTPSVTSPSLLCSCAGTCQNLARLAYKSSFVTRFQAKRSLD